MLITTGFLVVAVLAGCSPAQTEVAPKPAAKEQSTMTASQIETATFAVG